MERENISHTKLLTTRCVDYVESWFLEGQGAELNIIKLFYFIGILSNQGQKQLKVKLRNLLIYLHIVNSVSLNWFPTACSHGIKTTTGSPYLAHENVKSNYACNDFAKKCYPIFKDI